MVRGRAIRIVLGVAALTAVIGYLRDPPWLIDRASGVHPWVHPAGQPRYRSANGHASFFVPADAAAFEMPVSTPMTPGDDAPALVTVTVDDTLAARAVLTDASWTAIHVELPPPGSRRVRRVDVRTSVMHDGFVGVRIGELVFPPRLAGRLLSSAPRGT